MINDSYNQNIGLKLFNFDALPDNSDSNSHNKLPDTEGAIVKHSKRFIKIYFITVFWQ